MGTMIENINIKMDLVNKPSGAYKIISFINMFYPITVYQKFKFPHHYLSYLIKINIFSK